jgi:ribulose-phosphate 3-epimerase
MIKIAPSILSSDFARLGAEIDSINTADYVHFDVMDGSFVPNLALGIPELVSVRKYTDMTLDVHLMIADPLKYARRFAQAGADIVVFHIEAAAPENVKKALADIKAAGKRAGLSLKPKTPAKTIEPYLPELDIVLVMTVEPGFGGQEFMADMLPKIAELRQMINDGGYNCELEVDGGINPITAKLCTDAGADVIVAGSDIFNASDRAARIRELRG